ncbi:hypothetical protein [Leptospira santarosai]|uniref:hypothetical protein n=1 Tax=Leptospira santarosai TaxID=28183 RepID=UPI0009B79791|nr:hypothetical protein [Leptospira santarosai]
MIHFSHTDFVTGVNQNIRVILRTKLNTSIGMMNDLLFFGSWARAIRKAWIHPSVSREECRLNPTIFLEYKSVTKERYAKPSLTLM